MRTTYPRQHAPARGLRTWWGKAWGRAVEEAAYAEGDLRRARALARRGEVGGISVGPGSLLAAVREGDDAWTVSVEVPELAAEDRRALVEVVAAEAGRIAALLAGELPHDLIEHAEEAGVELLPYGGELACSCTCPYVLDPCAHALGVLVQVGWLVDADPLVLFAVRGLDREALLGELHARAEQAPVLTARDLADDVEIAADAVLRARRLAELLERGDEIPDGLL
ncbi:MAG TPA: SWIM zinc finger family protein [Nocardioides sp.]|nr:SWIM zinc finger family protein [Nocardioides sp.]